MTETTKTHVILLACGSFNPITKGHIQMFGESSRPAPEAASASPSPAPVFSWATEPSGVSPSGGMRQLIPLVGGQPLFSGLLGRNVGCASQASLARARPGTRGAEGVGEGRGRR